MKKGSNGGPTFGDKEKEREGRPPHIQTYYMSIFTFIRLGDDGMKGIKRLK